MLKSNLTADFMTLFPFAKNRLFIKRLLSILMLLTLFCTPDVPRANASFDTLITISLSPSEYLPLETEQAAAIIRTNKVLLPERGLNRETGFPLLALLFLLLYPLCTRSLRTLSRLSSFAPPSCFLARFSDSSARSSPTSPYCNVISSESGRLPLRRRASRFSLNKR